MKEDIVNEPSHYKQGGMEVRDVLKAFLGKEEYQGFAKGNIIKYVLRANYKGKHQEDLEKAQNYMNDLVEFLKEK